jgi:hypothetical protein
VHCLTRSLLPVFFAVAISKTNCRVHASPGPDGGIVATEFSGHAVGVVDALIVSCVTLVRAKAAARRSAERAKPADAAISVVPAPTAQADVAKQDRLTEARAAVSTVVVADALVVGALTGRHAREADAAAALPPLSRTVVHSRASAATKRRFRDSPNASAPSLAFEHLVALRRSVANVDPDKRNAGNRPAVVEGTLNIYGRLSRRDAATICRGSKTCRAEKDALVGCYCEGRAPAELHVASAFSQLGATLTETVADRSVLRLLERPIANEHRHSRQAPAARARDAVRTSVW